MHSLLQSITRPFSRAQSQQEAPIGSSGRPDQEEDGFLLVGSTASDRTTVHGGTFQANKIDAPPQYGQVTDNCLPTYQEFIGSNHPSPSLDVSMHPDLTRQSGVGSGPRNGQTGHQSNHEQSNITPDSMEYTNCSTNMTAITGVPFQLGPCCLSVLAYSDLKNCSALHKVPLDLSLFEYDFHVEQNYLLEHDILSEDRMEINSMRT